MKPWLVCLALVLVVSAAPAQEKPKLPAPLPVDETAIDAIVEKTLAAFQTPGAAVAVVRDGKVVYLKGHGLRDRDNKKPVTPDTLFAIASCSKAFTATAVAALVDASKMNWDDPVRKHLPFFRLSDPLADHDVTIADLLCHRTGLARHDVLRSQPWGREQLIRALAHIAPSKPFRSEFQYNNLMFLTAGYAAGKADGSDWDTVVRKRLFEPLGMTTARTSVAEMLKSSDYALPYGLEAGKVVAVPMRDTDNAAPGGAIKASVRDLSRWLLFQLDGGLIDGRQVVSAKQLRETHLPRITVRLSEAEKDPATVQTSYALGWFVQDYRGRRLVSHGGAIDGYRAEVVLAPREKLGVVVLSNLGGTLVPQVISRSLLDLLLGLPARDGIAQARRRLKQIEDAQRNQVKARQKERRVGRSRHATCPPTPEPTSIPDTAGRK